tara:strand:+ start:8831 stop:9250 length:420 start_codon:yes stop_codon:yes gene_type:complete
MPVPVSGHVEVRKNGVLVCSGANLVVTTGYTLFANLIGASATAPSHMAFGDSATAAAISDTALVGTEHERVAFGSTVVADSAIIYTATFGGLAGSEICQEMGIFNAASGGTMLCRFITQSFTISNGDVVTVGWTVTIGD